MATTSSPARFVLHDSLQAIDMNLVPRNDRRRRERYQIIDTQAGPGEDRVYDEFCSKKAARDTVRDLNAGVYGPLS